jgi:hypothetical protein
LFVLPVDYIISTNAQFTNMMKLDGPVVEWKEGWNVDLSRGKSSLISLEVWDLYKALGNKTHCLSQYYTPSAQQSVYED